MVIPISVIKVQYGDAKRLISRHFHSFQFQSAQDATTPLINQLTKQLIVFCLLLCTLNLHYPLNTSKEEELRIGRDYEEMCKCVNVHARILYII